MRLKDERESKNFVDFTPLTSLLYPRQPAMLQRPWDYPAENGRLFEHLDRTDPPPKMTLRPADYYGEAAGFWDQKVGPTLGDLIRRAMQHRP